METFFDIAIGNCISLTVTGKHYSVPRCIHCLNSKSVTFSGLTVWALSMVCSKLSVVRYNWHDIAQSAEESDTHSLY